MSNQELSELISQADKALDPALAASMAGLAITAAIFLLSFITPIAQNVNEAIAGGHTPNPEKSNTLRTARKAVRQLFASFYFFVVFLLESVTLDAAAQPSEDLSEFQVLQSGDVVLSGSCLTLGLLLLWFGARTMKTIVLKDIPAKIQKRG